MKKSAKKKHRRWSFVLSGLVLLIALYISWVYFVAAPTLSPSFRVSNISASVPAKALAWPTSGQSTVGLGSHIVATRGVEKLVAMASTAKLVTALSVLKKYPLSLNQAGPTITLGPSDVAIYDKYQAEDGSDLVIASGEKLSEYQMLQAMLLPSADNIADSLAIWAFGSLPNYSIYANQYVKDQGLSETHIGIDGSGFDPSSTTTASNLVSIGQLVMASPLLASIVGQTSATGFPLVGTIKNVNSLLGKDNIIGIKTGNTDQAGGVFLSASQIVVNSSPLVIYTATIQAPTLFDALVSSVPFIISVQGNFASVPGISSIQAGDGVGEYIVPWSHQTVSAVASQTLDFNSWGGSKVSKTVSLAKISDQDRADQVVGQMEIKSPFLNSASVNLILNQAINPPSKVWLVLHPGSFIRF